MSTPNLNASGYQFSGYNPNSQPAYANQYQQYPYGNTTADINASSASISSAFSNVSKASKLSALRNAFKRSNTASPQPPPVPKKDTAYLQALQNSGYSSAGGHPTEYYGIRPPGSSSAYDSNVSLTLSEASGSTRASAPGSNLTHKSSSAASFFKFGRKSKKARSPGSQPPTPTAEVSIPRNVKHELHVDDGLNGLPVAWHASLAKMGYTPEEIESIARRRRNPSMAVPLLAIGQTPTPAQLQAIQANSIPSSPISQPEAIQQPLPQAFSQDTWRPAPRQDSLPASPASQHSQPQFFPPARPSVRGRTDSHDGSVRSGAVQINRRGSPTQSVGSPTRTSQCNQSGSHHPQPLFATNPDLLSPPAALPQSTFAVQQVMSIDQGPEYEEGQTLSTTRAISPIPRTPVSPPRLTLKSDDRDSINWSDSLFSALPSTTAFEGLRSSVGPPQNNGNTTSTQLSRAASTSSLTKEPLRTISSPQQKTAVELRTDREGATMSRYFQANPPAGDRGSTGSIGLEEPAIVARATAITIARAPSMKRSAPSRVIVMGGHGTPPPVPQVYGRSDLGGSQQSLGSRRGSVEGSPAPVFRTLAHQGTGSTDTGNSTPITPQQGQELLQVANNSGFDSDEEDQNNRYTIRVDDAKAEQILAVVRGAKAFEGRPISTASAATIKDNPYTNGTLESNRDSVAEDDLLESYLDGDDDEEEGSDDDDGVLDEPNPQANKQPTLAIPPLRTNGSKHESLYQDEISPASIMSPGHSFIGSDGSGTPTMNSALPETPSPFHTSPGPGILSRLQQQQSVAPLNLVGKKTQAASNRRSKKTLSMLPLRRDIPPVLASLASEIQAVDPRAMFTNLVEIAEGESGSVYVADLIIQSPALAPLDSNQGDVVAVKKISVATASLKIKSIRHEIDILRDVQHNNVLGYHSLYFAEDALWLRIELMDRSCADLLGLYEVGLVVEEKHVACVTRDTLEGLAYLAETNIAHRDLRSDNILISKDGVIKLADFSSAVRVTRDDRMRSDVVGIIYWQAPEIRKGEYDVMLVDVWSLGATVWELVEGTTPFEGHAEAGDRLPELSSSENSSSALLDFLEMCSSPPHYRPPAQRLLETSFVKKACLRSEIVRLLSQARGLEQQLGG